VQLQNGPATVFLCCLWMTQISPIARLLTKPNTSCGRQGLQTHMKYTNQRAALVAALTYVGVSSLTLAQEEDPIIVTASRLPELMSSASSEVELFTPEEIEARQQDRLQDILNLTPGVHATSFAGQEGQTGSLFVRGLTTRYNQLSVDGIRVSHSINSGNYGGVLGAFQFGGADQLEVVLGSNGVVHGSAAIGGVIGITHSFDNAEEGSSFFQELGSDEYTSTQFSHVGSLERLDYYINASVTELEHDGVENEFENRQLSVGARYRVNDYSSIVLTGRTGANDLSTDSSIFQTDYDIVSLKHLFNADDYTASTVFGYFNQVFSQEGGSLFSSEYEKLSLTSDHSLKLHDIIQLGFGLDAATGEIEQVSSSTGITTTQEDTIGAYLNLEVDFVPLTLTAGIRGEENSLFGFITSYDLGAKVAIDETGSEFFLHASHGNRAPAFTESEQFVFDFGGGFTSTQLANPNIQEETVTSIELGLTQELSSNTQLSITGYAHFLQDAIQFQTTPSFDFINQNVSGTSEVYGIDFALTGVLAENFYYNVAWNYALKNDVTAGYPRNTVTADAHYDGGKWLLGAGVSHRSNANFGGGDLGSNLITRLYGYYQLTDHIQLTARVENLFDEDYLTDPFASSDPVTSESVAGVNGRGRSFYAGIKATW